MNRKKRLVIGPYLLKLARKELECGDALQFARLTWGEAWVRRHALQLLWFAKFVNAGREPDAPVAKHITPAPHHETACG